MTIDERLEALTTNLELMSGMTKDLLETSQKQGEKLEKMLGGMEQLLHIAEIHEHRITDLEGGRS